MPSLWKPESWTQRLAELEARSGDLKEAPLRRDVRSLGLLLGRVLREQAGEKLYAKVEELRRLFTDWGFKKMLQALEDWAGKTEDLFQQTHAG